MSRPKQFTNHEPDPILPKTVNQKRLIDAMIKFDQVVVLGPAGTGKTYITAGLAADWYAKSAKNQIYITRPMVPVGEDFGFLPGTLDEKVTPWAMPVLSVLEQRLGRGKLECDLGKNIQIIPLQLLRGRTFDNATILCDEAQNLTVEQAKMLVTRVGEHSTLLINGDLAQKDIRENSGLKWITDNIERYDLPVPVIEFDMDDCQRSGVCRMWLNVLAGDN